LIYRRQALFVTVQGEKGAPLACHLLLLLLFRKVVEFASQGAGDSLYDLSCNAVKQLILLPVKRPVLSSK
jgi:hypothetical protein